VPVRLERKLLPSEVGSRDSARGPNEVEVDDVKKEFEAGGDSSPERADWNAKQLATRAPSGAPFDPSRQAPGRPDLSGGDRRGGWGYRLAQILPSRVHRATWRMQSAREAVAAWVRDGKPDTVAMRVQALPPSLQGAVDVISRAGNRLALPNTREAYRSASAPDQAGLRQELDTLARDVLQFTGVRGFGLQVLPLLRAAKQINSFMEDMNTGQSLSISERDIGTATPHGSRLDMKVTELSVQYRPDATGALARKAPPVDGGKAALEALRTAFAQFSSSTEEWSRSGRPDQVKTMNVSVPTALSIARASLARAAQKLNLLSTREAYRAATPEEQEEIRRDLDGVAREVIRLSGVATIGASLQELCDAVSAINDFMAEMNTGQSLRISVRDIGKASGRLFSGADVSELNFGYVPPKAMAQPARQRLAPLPSPE
jgi:hypothetical protein